MKSKPVTACVLVVLLAGCGDDSSNTDRDPTGGTNGKPATSITRDGVYEVGVDIEPGVYLGSGPGCVGFTARNDSYDLASDERDAGDFITGSSLVGDVQRITVHAGEFFTSRYCPEWTLEEPGPAAKPDPATRTGACQILRGDDELVEQVLAVASLTPDQREDEDIDGMQERLMAVVFSHTTRLWKPAGELVDFLDDPGLYVERDGSLKEHVARAAADIERICTP